MSRGTAVVLTDKIINAMKPGEELWDSREPGLHVRMGAKGRSFLYFYTTAGGVRRKPSMKRGISLAMAREVAKEWADLVASGKDPYLLREEERTKAPPATLKDMEIRWEIEAKRSEQFWESVKKNNRFFEVKKPDRGIPFSFMKPSSICAYRYHWKDILAHFGEKKILTSFTSTEVAALHQKFSVQTPRTKSTPQKGGPRKANILVNFLGTLLQTAVIWGLMEEAESARFLVMFKRIQRNPEYGKDRYITGKEMPKLKKALEILKGPLTKEGKKKHVQQIREDRRRAYFIELLLATGSRRGEFMTAKLSWISWTEKVPVIRLPDTKVGPQVVPLANKLRALLKERTDEWVEGGKKKEEDWVVPSPRKYGEPLRNPRKGWIAFLKLAELDPSITLHTIRHTIATQGMNEGGLSLEDAADILGHANVDTTKGYAHKKNLTKRMDSMNKATDALDAMMAGAGGTTEHSATEILPDYIKKERAEAKLLNEAPVTSAH